jgi:hypothetical protein
MSREAIEIGDQPMDMPSFGLPLDRDELVGRVLESYMSPETKQPTPVACVQAVDVG